MEANVKMSDWRTMPEPVAPDLIESVHEADVVVVGMGYAGTTAARAAAEAGVKVIGLEAQRREVFMSLGRDVGHINSEFLRSRGVPDVDPIDLFNEMMKRAGNRANPALLMKYAQNCGETFNWFTDMYGVEGMNDVHVAFWPEGCSKFKAEKNATLNDYHFWHGTAEFPEHLGWPGEPTLTDVLGKNQEKAEALGAELFFGTQAVQPVLEHGKVCGIIACDRDGAYHKYLAKKGVVLAAGDFSGNQELVEDLVTDIGDMLMEGQQLPLRGGRKGQGHQIGVWAGGRLEPRPLPTMSGNYFDIPGVTTFGILWLDRRGKRFCNEIFGGPELAALAYNQMPRGVVYNIFDEHILEDLQWAVPAHGGFDEHDPRKLEGLKQILKNAEEHPCGHPDSTKPLQSKPVFPYIALDICSGTTPEELVRNSGIEGEVAANIVASIERYNELCRKGRDEDFGKDTKLLRPLEGRLFLQASEMKGNFDFMLVSVGGFVTDEDQNVLGQDYEPIPGLYASGNCCGRRFGQQYTTPISGISIGMAITLGREAGKAVAAAPDLDCIRS